MSMTQAKWDDRADDNAAELRDVPEPERQKWLELMDCMVARGIVRVIGKDHLGRKIYRKTAIGTLPIQMADPESKAAAHDAATRLVDWLMQRHANWRELTERKQCELYHKAWGRNVGRSLASGSLECITDTQGRKLFSLSEENRLFFRQTEAGRHFRWVKNTEH
jgi:hypothetical protein